MNDTVEVQLTAPGRVATMWLIAQAPDFNEIELPSEEFMVWGAKVVAHSSELGVEDVQGISLPGAITLIGECTALMNEAHGLGEAARDENDHKLDTSTPFDGMDLDDQGAVDLEDMR